MLLDLHVHSHHSAGGNLAPRDIVRRAKEAGLDGVVVTDLNNLDALDEVRAAGREQGFLALCGVEVTTDHGHYLCYFPDPAAVPALPQVFGTTPWPVREVLRFVAERRGVAVAAHPYDKTIDRPSGDFIFTLDGLSAIEGLCGRCRGGANDLAIEAADHLNLPCVAGSGARASVDEIGAAATLFREPVASEAELVAQIRAGAVYCVAIGAVPAQPSDARGPDRRGGDRRDRGGRPGGDRRGGPRGRGGGRDRR